MATKDVLDQVREETAEVLSVIENLQETAEEQLQSLIERVKGGESS